MCQFWLNTTDGRLTSPYYPARYSNNLNCTWMIYAQEGFYINLEITYFWVNKFQKSCLDFPKYYYHYSCIGVTFYLFMMYMMTLE